MGFDNDTNKMYLYVPVRHYPYNSAADSKGGLFLKPFLTFITYRVPWHLVENIYGSCATGTAHYHVPQNGHFSLNV